MKNQTFFQIQIIFATQNLKFQINTGKGMMKVQISSKRSFLFVSLIEIKLESFFGPFSSRICLSKLKYKFGQSIWLNSKQNILSNITIRSYTSQLFHLIISISLKSFTVIQNCVKLNQIVKSCSTLFQIYKNIFKKVSSHLKLSKFV